MPKLEETSYDGSSGIKYAYNERRKSASSVIYARLAGRRFQSFDVRGRNECKNVLV